MFVQRTLRILASLSIFTSIAAYSSTQGQTLYVGPGTSIQKVVDRASPGSTIILQKGVHRVVNTITISKPLQISGQQSTISFDFPASAASSSGRLFEVQSSDVTISGVEFDG